MAGRDRKEAAAMKSKEKYERMLCGCAYEDAMETADALIADKKFDELDALVEAAENQGRVSFLTDISLSLIDADEVSKGFDVAILAACITDREWPEGRGEEATAANPDSEGETIRLLLDAYSTTGDIETLHSLVNFAYLKGLAEREANLLDEAVAEAVRRRDFDAVMDIVASATRNGDADRASRAIYEAVAAGIRLD